MTTCKEQEIRSRCIIEEKVPKKKNENGNGSGNDNGGGDGSNGNGKNRFNSMMEDKQFQRFKEIAVCMQKCMSKGNGNGKEDDCKDSC